MWELYATIIAEKKQVTVHGQEFLNCRKTMASRLKGAVRYVGRRKETDG